MTNFIRSIRIVAAVAVLQAVVVPALHAEESAPLYSISAQTYHLTLTGKLETLGRPVSGTDVQFSLQTSLHNNVQAVVKTQDDGTYTIQVAFAEFPMGQIDWTVTALDSRVIEEGRQILPENTEIQIVRPVSVASRVVLQTTL